MRAAFSWFNIALRGVMEAGIVFALAYWGYHVIGNAFARIAIAIITPVVGFGFWGAVDFRSAGRAAESLRLIQELAISGLAAGGLYVMGQPELGLLLAAISILHHGLVYALGERLLKARGRLG